jgi:tetraacyldisaccharide 4'-kinase
VKNLAQPFSRLWFREPGSPALLLLLPLLLPLSWLFRLLVAVRGLLYRKGILPAVALPVPVVVVGNLTVGGAGKTPLTLWLAERLREAGRRPGIISRGYGGAGKIAAVTPQSDAAAVGDEPLLLARRSGVPVFVGRDRVATGKALLAAHPECGVLISDDGLQHYRLARCAEIAVFDRRGLGNGHLLPAGPLREPPGRLAGVSAVVGNGGIAVAIPAGVPAFTMHLSGRRFVALDDPRKTCTAADLAGKPLHAAAWIGNPSRFFAQLAGLGLEFSRHPFPDHQVFRAGDLAFARGGVLLVTEKDAVKCTASALARAGPAEAWMLPVEACVGDAPDGASLLSLILEKLDGRAPA